MNRATIAMSGVIPFTKLLLEHPEIRKGGAAVQENREAAADAAVAAASGGGGLNMGGLNVRLEAVRREKEDRRRHGMEIEDDGIAPGALGADAAATLAGMDAVKAKGGAIFGAAMLAGDTAGIEFSGDYIRGRAQELARQHRGKDAKAASDAALRVLAQCTEAGRDGRGGEARGGRGGRGRVPWKEVAAELQTAHDSTTAALHARIRELESSQGLAPSLPAHLLPPPLVIAGLPSPPRTQATRGRGKGRQAATRAASAELRAAY